MVFYLFQNLNLQVMRLLWLVHLVRVLLLGLVHLLRMFLLLCLFQVVLLLRLADFPSAVHLLRVLLLLRVIIFSQVLTHVEHSQ